MQIAFSQLVARQQEPKLCSVSRETFLKKIIFYGNKTTEIPPKIPKYLLVSDLRVNAKQGTM